MLKGFDRFERPSFLKAAFPVFLGAVLGSLLTVFTAYYYLQAAGAFPLKPPASENPIGEDDEPENNYVLPEHQNTAVIRAVQKVTPAVVGISNRRITYDFFSGARQLREVGSGSGVVIRSDGLIATNYHVIDQATEVYVIFADGEEIKAEIVGADPLTDLAVLKVAKEGLPQATFGDSSKLQVGEIAIAIGNPLGLAFQQSVTQGVISATERFIDEAEYRLPFIQTDAAINPGNSGGPLVDLRGEVIGINSAKIIIQGFEGMGFAIPSNIARDIVQELIENGRINRPFLGVTIDQADPITPETAEEMELPVSHGIIVVEVVSGSPAERAGIKPGDIIFQLAGKDVKSFDGLRQILFDHRPGDKVELKLVRERKEMAVMLTLEEIPE